MGDWYHCSVQSLSRSSGHSAVAAAAYRAGARLEDARSDTVHDYTRKQGVAAAFLVTPAGAPERLGDRSALWNEAEAAETRKNARTARELRLALPSEADDTGRRTIAQEMAAWLSTTYGVAVDVAIHRPDRTGDRRNHHAHLLFTTREVGADGFGKKTRAVDDRTTGPQEIERIRATAARIINQVLEHGYSPERVDHRSYARRGIEREPTVHEGRRVRHAFRKAEAAGRTWQPQQTAEMPAAPAGAERAQKAARMVAYRQESRAAFNTAVKARRRSHEAHQRRTHTAMEAWRQTVQERRPQARAAFSGQASPTTRLQLVNEQLAALPEQKRRAYSELDAAYQQRQAELMREQQARNGPRKDQLTREIAELNGRIEQGGLWSVWRSLSGAKARDVAARDLRRQALEGIDQEEAKDLRALERSHIDDKQRVERETRERREALEQERDRLQDRAPETRGREAGDSGRQLGGGRSRDRGAGWTPER